MDVPELLIVQGRIALRDEPGQADLDHFALLDLRFLRIGQHDTLQETAKHPIYQLCAQCSASCS